MLGGKNKQPLGYTIIEVMIVLAVSGLMFVIASSFINGKQANTAFSTGVNELGSQIQDVIEQVNDGKFSDIPVKCVADATNGELTITPLSSGETQGTNSDCVFVGKLIHFYIYPGNNVNGSDYEIYTIAGCKTTVGCGSPTDIFKSFSPTPVIATPLGTSDLTQPETTPSHLQIKDVSVTPIAGHGLSTTTTANNIAFFQAFGAVASSYIDISNESGAQSSSLAYAIGPSKNGVIDGSNANQATGETNVSSDIVGSGTFWASSATVCITDGAGRYAEIDIGGTGSQLSATVKMDSVATEC